MRVDPELALAELRRRCGGWPEVSETRTFGHPTFKAGTRTFAVLEPQEGQWAVVFPAGLMQSVLLTDPRFLRPPYVGHRGWVSLPLRLATGWDEVEALLRQAYLGVALKRMRDRLEGGS